MQEEGRAEKVNSGNIARILLPKEKFSCYLQKPTYKSMMRNQKKKTRRRENFVGSAETN